MGYGYCNDRGNGGHGGHDGCGCNNNNPIDDLKKLAKAFLAAHKDFEENLDEASNFANKALCSLKDSAEAFNCSLKYAEKIAKWIERYGCKYDYDFEGCEDLEKELEMLLCLINKDLKETIEELCEVVKDINGIKKLDDKFDKDVEAYIECVEDNNDDGCGCKGKR